MSKTYYDPLLKQYFGNPKLVTFEDKEYIKKAFDQSKALSKKKEHVAESNTGEYNRLIKGLSLQKVLVGSYGRKPFYALVDIKENVCLPLIETNNE